MQITGWHLKESQAYIGLKNAGVPVEMHLYAQGGHAFGLRRTHFEITNWPRLVEKWLKSIDILESYTEF